MDGLGNKWPVMFMVMSESNSEAGYAVAVIHNIYFRFHNLVFFFFGLFLNIQSLVKHFFIFS